MSVEVPFPRLSQDPETEGVVSTWFVASGDVVVEGQLIAEVQVDKVANDVASPAAGTITLLVPEEAVVRQSAAIAVID